jgi:uncharacterized membrane protein
MKRLLDILKTTALGGIGILLPLLLFCLLVREIFEFVVALATPIGDLLARRVIERLNAPVLIAILLLVGVSMLLGLAARTATGIRLGRGIERSILGRLPLYDFVKNLSAAIVPNREGRGFKPALLRSTDGSKEPAYVIEAHDNGDFTVLVPWAPAAFAGSLKIVPSDQVELLDISLMEFSAALSRLGMGVEGLLNQDGCKENVEPQSSSHTNNA